MEEFNLGPERRFQKPRSANDVGKAVMNDRSQEDEKGQSMRTRLTVSEKN